MKFPNIYLLNTFNFLHKHQGQVIVLRSLALSKTQLILFELSINQSQCQCQKKSVPQVSGASERKQADYKTSTIDKHQIR